MINIIIEPPRDIQTHSAENCGCHPFVFHLANYQFEIHNAFDFRNIPDIMLTCGIISEYDFEKLLVAYKNVTSNIFNVIGELNRR